MLPGHDSHWAQPSCRKQRKKAAKAQAGCWAAQGRPREGAKRISSRSPPPCPEALSRPRCGEEEPQQAKQVKNGGSETVARGLGAQRIPGLARLRDLAEHPRPAAETPGRHHLRSGAPPDAPEPRWGAGSGWFTSSSTACWTKTPSSLKRNSKHRTFSIPGLLGPWGGARPRGLPEKMPWGPPARQA